ncbi:MAG: ABC-F family ATP-binding cassette domain-containing protein [Lachnospiraceae bacterium]|nr:ABC-F family ATP-binding cassette domain-containing protein [Lachnospiraceae bacterium]
MSTVLSVSNLKKEFGERVLFEGVSFLLSDNQRLAIVGPNGCGKSTLLNIIAGVLEESAGSVHVAPDSSIGYLEQYQDLEMDFDDIYSYVLSVRSDILEMEARLAELERQMDDAKDGLDQILEEYHALSHIFDSEGGHSYRSEAVGVLKGLGFSDSDLKKPMGELSGGQKTRVNLARLLLKNPDLLLLDEPVNHLDMASIEWLEGFLANYKKGVLLVAHDRYFLDKVATDVLDIGSSDNRLYHGNYSSFVSQKAELQKSYRRAYDKQQKEIRHQEEVIQGLKRFNREKSIRRAESRQKKLDSMERMDAPEKEAERIRLSLMPDSTSGKDVLTVENLSKSFDEKALFAGLDFYIGRGERVALIGDNGCGKTTILKIINEVIPPDGGVVRIGAGVTIAYFDQEQQNLDENRTLFEELQNAYPNLTDTKIRNVLAAFLFKSDDAFKYIYELSGGERGRISLCKLMLSGANFLILDEPTNHLDMESKEILGQALLSFGGTVLYVSHDRYFINQTAMRILELRAGKGLREFLGNYDYYLEKREILSSGTDASKESAAARSTSSKEDWKQKKEENARLRKLENDRRRIEEEIEALELENEEIDADFLKEEIAKDSEKLSALVKRQKEIADLLAGLYEQWDALVS